MKRSLITLALLSALALAAHATPGGEHSNTGCNGKGNSNSPCTGSGGAGGAGGDATAAAIAAAAAQANATAIAAQQQAQRQQQTATGGNATAMGGNSHASSGGNVLTQQVGAVTVEGDTYIAPAQERNPVATAYAAPVTATNGTCMGSTSGGLQLAGWGASGASTWTDTSCDIRYDAEALRAAGLPIAARERLCQKADIAKAMEAAGTPCRGTAKRASAAPQSDVTAAASLNLLP